MKYFIKRKSTKICILIFIFIIIILLFINYNKSNKDKDWDEKEIYSSKLDSTMINVTTSQDQEWSYPDNYGYNVTMNLNYSNSIEDTGKFIPKMFSGDGGLNHYISHRYSNTVDGFWNDIVFYIDSYCSSLSKSLNVLDWDKNDFKLVYHRNKTNFRDEFSLICKDPDKYGFKDKLILSYMFLDGDTYRTVYLSEWIQKDLDLNKSISNEFSKYSQNLTSSD